MKELYLELPKDADSQFARAMEEITISPITFDRIFISNVLHDAILNNLISEANPRDLSNIYLLLERGYGKSVADYNKRMQLYTDRTAEASPMSYESRPSGLMRLAIAEDIITTGDSDTDGVIITRQKLFDDTVKSMGFSPNAGALKPVIAGQIGGVHY